jgi:hypothetical protein
MTQARFQRRRRHPRLLRVDLPRVEVEDRRALLRLVDAGHRPAREAVRKQAEEAASARGHAAASDFDGGDGELEEIAARQRAKGEARGFAPAIMVVGERGDAGRIGIAFLGEDLVRPGGAGVDREARRPVAARLDAAGVCDGGVGAAQVGAERFGRQGENAVMVPAVAGDFVSGGDDAAD